MWFMLCKNLQQCAKYKTYTVVGIWYNIIGYVVIIVLIYIQKNGKKKQNNLTTV